LFGKYSPEKAEGIKALDLDRKVISERGLKYECLDQLTIDLLLGMRS
jgi:xylose isomerase